MNPILANPPTISTSSLCSLGAALGVNTILRVALPLGASALDTSIEFCAFSNRCITTRFARNANCPVDHELWNVLLVEKPLAKTALSELTKVAGLNPNASQVSFTVDGFNWIESGACHCATPKSVRRFVTTERNRVGRCSKCKSPILAQPIFTHRAVVAALLGDALEQPLEKLGAARARCVLMGTGDQSILFREPNPQLLVS